jgi:ubiquinone biosynthesis protein UbiJ
VIDEETLDGIERGLDRWHSVSPDIARTLVREIRSLRGRLYLAEKMHEVAVKERDAERLLRRVEKL